MKNKADRNRFSHFLRASLFALGLFTTSNIVAQTPDWEWAKSAGDLKDEHTLAVAPDASGNVYAAGYFQSDTVYFGSYALINPGYYSEQIFLVKYDVNGNVLWATSAGGTESEKAHSVAVDADGNVYIAGYFMSSSISFGTTTLNNSGATYADMYVAKYDSNGNPQWAKSAWGTSHDYANGVAVDASGNVYVTGYSYSESMDFGGASTTNTGETDIFIVKYNSSGTTQWAKMEGGTWIDAGQSVTTDASGNFFVAGWFSSASITIGTTTLYNADCCSGEAFIAKYDSEGNSLWAKSGTGDWGDQVDDVVTDGFGNSYIAGYFRSSSITFGSTTLDNNGDVDVFIAKYDADGNEQWSHSAGAAAEDEAHSVATDAFGNIYMTGWFAGSYITFGSITLTNGSIGFHDIFLVKYDGSGNVQWAKSAGSTSHDQAFSVATDQSGNVWVGGGYASSSIDFDSTTLINNSVGDYDMFVAKIGDTILQPPISAFMSSDTALCEKFCIGFTDQSLNNPVSWNWIFEGASPSTSTDQNPTNICYDDPGVFDVTLITTNANGLSDTLTLDNYITVYQNPFAPTITQSGNTLTSSFGTTYQWYLNGNIIPGATNQTYMIMQSGLYTVEIANENGCKSQSSFEATYVGIEWMSDDEVFAVYPNPTSGIFTIEGMQLSSGTELITEVLNALGQKIFTEEEKINTTSFNKEIDLSNMEQGIFLLNIKMGDLLIQKKILIIH